jgi:hypothetical protein
MECSKENAIARKKNAKKIFLKNSQGIDVLVKSTVTFEFFIQKLSPNQVNPTSLLSWAVLGPIFSSHNQNFASSFAPSRFRVLFTTSNQLLASQPMNEIL